MKRLRSIIEDQLYRDEASALQPDMRRLDEQMDAIVWALARDAESFTLIRDNLYVLETTALAPDEDYVFVYYTVEEETVTLRSVVRGSALTESPTLINVP